VKRNTLAENAEIYNLAAQAMEKLYGGAGGNFALFEKRGRGGLMTNMFGDMVSPDWWIVLLTKSIKNIWNILKPYEIT